MSQHIQQAALEVGQWDDVMDGWMKPRLAKTKNQKRLATNDNDASSITATCADLSTSCEAHEARSNYSKINSITNPGPQPSWPFHQCSYTTTCIQFVKNEDSGSLVERQNVSKCLLLLYTNFIHLYTSFKILDLCIQFVRPTGKPSAAELPVNCEAVEFPGRKSRALRANAESQMNSSKLVQIQQGHRFATKLERNVRASLVVWRFLGALGFPRPFNLSTSSSIQVVQHETFQGKCISLYFMLFHLC